MQFPDLGPDNNLAFGAKKSYLNPIPILCDLFDLELIAKNLNEASEVDSINTAMIRAMMESYGCLLLELQKEVSSPSSGRTEYLVSLIFLEPTPYR